MSKGIFHRAELILGTDKMQNIASKKVILFGIGGVGSWCAESLIRTGVMDLTIVDSDRVTASNINRQLMATSKTIGEVKTEALKNRLLKINPTATITSLQKIYSRQTSEDFDLHKYDVIIDAIDSLGSKVHLIRAATETDALFVSSMGAALKVDPTRVRVDEFWNVQGCPLARKIRKLIRKLGKPGKPFMCVYSDEVMENIILNEPTDKEQLPEVKDTTGPGDPELVNHDWSDKKAVINGSLAHITAIFGFTLAGLIIQELTK